MDMKQMVDGAQGADMGPGMNMDAKMMDMLTHMRDMVEQMMQMMGADGQQAGFNSVDKEY